MSDLHCDAIDTIPPAGIENIRLKRPMKVNTLNISCSLKFIATIVALVPNVKGSTFPIPAFQLTPRFKSIRFTSVYGKANICLSCVSSKSLKPVQMYKSESEPKSN